MLFDLQTLTGAAKAFINADQAALLRGALKLLPVGRSVVETLDSVVPNPEVIAACSALRQTGYVPSLDDFDDHPKWHPLLAMVTISQSRFSHLGSRAAPRDGSALFAEGFAIGCRESRNAI